MHTPMFKILSIICKTLDEDEISMLKRSIGDKALTIKEIKQLERKIIQNRDWSETCNLILNNFGDEE